MSEVLAETYSIENYESWDHTIYLSAKQFKEKNTVWPNILIANEGTLEALSLFMSKKLMAEGISSAPKDMGVFACRDFSLEICLEPELKDHKFTLIYDDQAEFLEQEPETQDRRPDLV